MKTQLKIFLTMLAALPAAHAAAPTLSDLLTALNKAKDAEAVGQSAYDKAKASYDAANDAYTAQAPKTDAAVKAYADAGLAVTAAATKSAQATAAFNTAKAASAAASKALLTGQTALKVAQANEAKATTNLSTLTAAASKAKSAASDRAAAYDKALSAYTAAKAAADAKPKDTKLAASAASAKKASDTAKAASDTAAAAQAAADAKVSDAQKALKGFQDVSKAASGKIAELTSAASAASSDLEKKQAAAGAATSALKDAQAAVKVAQAAAAAAAKLLATAKTVLSAASGALNSATSKLATLQAATKAAQAKYDALAAAGTDASDPNSFSLQMEMNAMIPQAMPTMVEGGEQEIVIHTRKSFSNVRCAVGPESQYQKWKDGVSEGKEVEDSFGPGRAFWVGAWGSEYEINYYSMRCVAKTSAGEVEAKRTFILSGQIRRGSYKPDGSRNSPCGFRANGIPSEFYAAAAAKALKPSLKFSSKTNLQTLPYAIEGMTVGIGKEKQAVVLNNLKTNHKSLELNQAGTIITLRRHLAGEVYGCNLHPTFQKLYEVREKGSMSWFKWFTDQNEYPEYGIEGKYIALGTPGSKMGDFYANSNAAVGQVLAVTADGRGVLMDEKGTIVKTFPKVSTYLRNSLRGIGVKMP